jgi:hypothetical protein
MPQQEGEHDVDDGERAWLERLYAATESAAHDLRSLDDPGVRQLLKDIERFGRDIAARLDALKPAE